MQLRNKNAQKKMFKYFKNKGKGFLNFVKDIHIFKKFSNPRHDKFDENNAQEQHNKIVESNK